MIHPYFSSVHFLFTYNINLNANVTVVIVPSALVLQK